MSFLWLTIGLGSIGAVFYQMDKDRKRNAL